MKRKTLLAALALVLGMQGVSAQQQWAHTPENDPYFKNPDPKVQQKLQDWEDIKFGLLMHWGTYSEWGIVESWSLCPEDEGWCQRKMNNYVEYKQKYEDLQKTFNPVKFNPEKWADAAEDAGMKYVVFTTKHHDGFCMFDTQTTDYKITDDKCPFHTNPKADVTKAIFDAFRAKDFMIGAYFSKPDWHCENYWNPYFPPVDRNPNYEIEKHTDWWQKYVDFTQTQIDELMSNYGQIDILWLDGGWVEKATPEEVEARRMSPKYHRGSFQNQDINMNKIAADARKKQPGLIVVDRAVKGPNQDYLTPENKVPKQLLPYPWESNITSGGGYSYTPGAKYKTPDDVIKMLVDIVAKGGNLLLNIAPGPNGDFDPNAYVMLKGVGKWMHKYSGAIYNTRAIWPYKDGNVDFAQNKNSKEVYAIYVPDTKEDKLPTTITLHTMKPAKGAKVTLMGSNAKLKVKKEGDGCVITIPTSAIQQVGKQPAYPIKISSVDAQTES